MITQRELLAFLKELFSDCDRGDDFCPNGLQVEGKKEIRAIAVAVSASQAAIERAIDHQADALIVHHGIFWNKDSYVVEGSKRKKLELLLAHQLSLIAYHLPLDAHPEVGNNWAAAIEMGWQECLPFANIGVQGKFQTTSEQLQKQLEDYYHHPAQVVLGGKKKVERIALISGGAHRYLQEAANAGVDAFITGTVDEPVWHQAHELKINFYGLGHFATEVIGPRALANLLRHHFQMPVHLILEENPF